MKKIFTLSIIILLFSLSCSPQPEAKKGTSPERNTKFDYFFIEWLKNHGETPYSSKKGVSVKGKSTFFSASTYGKEQKKDSYTVELEFTTILPDGRKIQDFVVGWSSDEKSATDEALANFALTAFHPLYSAFINEADPHLHPENIDISGNSRKCYIGDWGILEQRDMPPIKPEILNSLKKYFIEQIKIMKLDEKTHWIKIVHGEIDGKILASETTIDNQIDPGLNAAIKQAPWPKQKSFYTLKLYIIIK